MNQAKLIEWARRFNGVAWKKLEIEEQALARDLMRRGLAHIAGEGAERCFRLGAQP